MTWHRPGCEVTLTDNDHRVRETDRTTLASGDYAISYKCQQCRAVHVVIVDRDHRD